MKKRLGPFKISFTVDFNIPLGKATLKLRSISEIKKIKVKFALKDELNQLLTFEELSIKYLELPIPKGFDPSFYIINEETGQKAKIVISIDKIWPPKAKGNTHVFMPPRLGNISRQVKKIAG